MKSLLTNVNNLYNKVNKNKYCNIIYLTVGTVILFIIVFFLGTYIRNGGSDILLWIILGAIPTGFTIIVISYMLRNADRRVQLFWCSIVMILIRSVQLWRPGIDFGDELHLIKATLDYFQTGQLSGYIKKFPANIPFVAIFYIFYLILPDIEMFELLVLFVYPLLVIGYYLMAKEIMKLYGNSSNPAIPAIMFLPFAPTFIIRTFYSAQVLGWAVLFFSCAILLHLLSIKSLKVKHWVIVVVSSTILVFTHSISTAMFILTIIFLYLAYDNKAKRWILLRIGGFTFLMYTVAHFNWNLKMLRLIVIAIQGDVISLQSIKRFGFTNIYSIFRNGLLMTLTHTGLFVVVGLLILQRSYRLLNHRFIVTIRSKTLFVEWLTLLKSDTMVFSYFGFSGLSFVFGFFLYGSFLDPVRLMSWASLFVLPVIIPSKKSNALLLMVTLLTLFFLLIWVLNSPWGYLFGYVNGLNVP